MIRSTIMRRVAVFNDTTPSRHFGCYAVMKTLVNELRQIAIEPTFYWPVGNDWRPHKRWIAKQRLDGIIVNGEGSIHDSLTRDRARYLCELSTFARHALKCPSVLLNATINNLTAESLEHLQNFDLVYAREHATREYLNANAIPCRMVPDLSFFADPAPCAINRTNQILVTDSVLGDTRRLLERFAKKHNHLFYPMRPPRENLECRHDSYRGIFGRLIHNAGSTAPWPRQRHPARDTITVNTSYDSLLRQLTISSGVLTGRFHALTLSIVHKSPVLAIESNTQKISFVLKDIFNQTSRTISPRLAEGLLTDHGDIAIPYYSPAELSQIDAYIARGRSAKGEMFHAIQCLLS
jgi:hypothetical protein